MNGFAPLLAALALSQVAPEPPADAPRAEPPAAPVSPALGPDLATTAARVRRSPPVDPAVERAEAERVARSFLDALAARDADRITEACSDRFSFDGDAQAGRGAVRRAWRQILAGREGPTPGLGRVEVLAAADAVARHGKPPARVAPLARPGALAAVADVGGRAVVLFLAREGGRMAVLGMHD